MSTYFNMIDPMYRFYNFIELSENGCWNWIGSTAGKYGKFWVRRTGFLAHRFSYIIFKGMPQHTIDHLCKNTLCVNPEHLEDVTLKENIHRGDGVASINWRKTQCPKGHMYSGVNNRGGRVCGSCQNAAYKKYRSKLCLV